MEIETLAVTEIQSLVARCDHLQPFIASNDKTPFTDGHIDVYGATGRKKPDWLGRVSVQVKGRGTPGKPPQRKKFPIARTDLAGFQRDGGVLYFVVSVDTRTGACTPYYAVLTPYVIAYLLDQVPGDQASISVAVKPFPANPLAIESIVRLALKGREQNPSLGVDPVLFEKVQGFSVFTTSDLNWEAPIMLTPGETDFVLEMRTSGGSSVPLGGVFKIVPGDYVAKEFHLAVRAGESTYREITTRRIDPETVEVLLAEGLTLIVRSSAEQREFNVNVSPPSNFADRLKALEFVAAIADHGEIEIGDQTFSIGGTAVGEDPKQQIRELREHLAYLHELRELFAHLGVDGSHVNLDEVSDAQVQNLRTLHRAFVHGEELLNERGETGRSLVALGRWELMFLIMPGTVPNRWRFVDPFDPETPQQFKIRTEGDGQEGVAATIYDIIERESFPNLLNLRLDSVVRTYETISDPEQATSLANHVVLHLISAADTCAPRKEEFLRGATALNEWVISKDGDRAIHLVNRWQIDWRNGALTASVRESVRELKRSMVRSEEKFAAEIELACALLLDDVDEASYLVTQMPKEKLLHMETWPIWRLREQPGGTSGSPAIDV